MITAILLGAGDRGKGVFGEWALQNKDKLKFVAIAEPNDNRREAFAYEHNIPPENKFRTWEDALEQGKMADVCFVATQDQLHTKPVLKALQKDYHVLVEKPMATNIDECYQMIEKAEKSGKQLWIAHVLRYTPFFTTIKKAIDNGMLGKIINIKHSENISYWHFAHSYVRGKWRRSEETSPVVLAKTSHDLDILYWLTESPAEKVSSFGNINYYKPENAPNGAGYRCMDDCKITETCQWHAPRLYLEAEPILQVGMRSKSFYKRLIAWMALNYPGVLKVFSYFIPALRVLTNWNRWPVSVITDEYSEESKLKQLKEGPYGRCVFFCDNNVCDNQVVNIEFKNGITATLTLHGFASFEGRWIRIEGSEGTLFGKFSTEHQEIVVYDHYNTQKKVLMDVDLELKGHMGGDDGIMHSLVTSLESGKLSDSAVLTSGKASLESHLMAFAAEKSRLGERIIYLDEIRKKEQERSDDLEAI